RASQLENWKIGGFNTGVLLCSSLSVALAVHDAQIGRRTDIVNWLLLTILFGSIFLGIKAYEYHHLFAEKLVPGAQFDVPRFEHGEQLPHHFPEHLRRNAQI